MGISLKKWLIGKLYGDKNNTVVDVSFQELWELAEEVQVRELAFNTCVNMIANAVGKCEFKTFKNQIPVQGKEYFSWNFEPNMNQNSTEFLHKLIYQLYRENEVLVIVTQDSSRKESFHVADSFKASGYRPTRQN